ncbi:MAG: UDP-N-acetylmuramoyl-L-alanine--D-glutamate ligase [Eggerthellaceae bacterium]|nr:UDP-N-acetylmuramoyl-L-alanine--D-glutamate ligase [Eggerthellaceae bacterium]
MVNDAKHSKTGAQGHIGDVLVLGLGKSGKSVVRYCAQLLGSRVTSMFVAAGAFNADSQEFCESFATQGVEYAFGDDALTPLAEAGRHFDICIASPGIPYWHDLYVQGSVLSDELVSEVEFAWRESAPESVWVAITGTNGKTTTTSCCAHVLKACGFEANAVGNIGDVCLDAVAVGMTRVYVAELSSYQLYSTNSFTPDVAVMLNITPDHVHWHKTFEAYRDAKYKLFDHLGEAPGKPVAILDATNDVVRAKVRELKALSRDERGFDYLPLGTAEGIRGDMRARCGAENAAFVDADNVLHVAFAGCDHALLPADELLIEGEHNVSNALAAASVAVTLGADDQDIARALRTFAPLEHRIEPCGQVAGVACYNDSKATNVDATVKALAAFPGKRVIALLGGDDKGTSLDELAEAVLAHVARAVCFGAAGERFACALEDARAAAEEAKLAIDRAEHLVDALDCALANAQAGDVVLLSPACASFDEFTSFEQRGKVFKELVAQRAEAAAASETLARAGE